MATVAPSRARLDIERQKVHDRNRDGHQGALLARMAAVVDAQHAVAQRQEGATWALRQSLVDLAAIAELLADDLPPPSV